MDYPPFLEGKTEAEYRTHFESVYCQGPLPTFDGIQVRFRKNDFDHAFFESSSPKSKDDVFSAERSKRIDWIKTALADASADLRVGYDNQLRRLATDRRVAIVKGNFVAIIRIIGEEKAEFVTCYIASTWTLQKIRKSPKWPRKKKRPDDGSA